jgi:hypothetical protein
LTILGVTSSSSTITVRLALDEPGTAACRSYTSTQGALDFATVLAAGFSALVGPAAVGRGVDVTTAGLNSDSLYYVYCSAQDDEDTEGAATIDPPPAANAMPAAQLATPSGWRTVDDLAPVLSSVTLRSETIDTIAISLQLNDQGTVFCDAFHQRSNIVPSSALDIYAAQFSTLVTAGQQATVVISGLERDAEYRVFCSGADETGNFVSFGSTLALEQRMHTIGKALEASLGPHFSPGTGTKWADQYDPTGSASATFRMTFDVQSVAYGSGHIIFRSDAFSDVLVKPGEAAGANGTALIDPAVPNTFMVTVIVPHVWDVVAVWRVVVPQGVILPADGGLPSGTDVPDHTYSFIA